MWDTPISALGGSPTVSHGMCLGSWLPRGYQGRGRRLKALIFMYFHEVFLRSQHEIWSKQLNGKVSQLIQVETSDVIKQKLSVNQAATGSDG
jgi:hypothetical protein